MQGNIHPDQLFQVLVGKLWEHLTIANAAFAPSWLIGCSEADKEAGLLQQVPKSKVHGTSHTISVIYAKRKEHSLFSMLPGTLNGPKL